MDMGDTEKRGEQGDHAQGREVADHRPDDLPVHVDSDHGRPGDVFDLRQTARRGSWRIQTPRLGNDGGEQL